MIFDFSNFPFILEISIMKLVLLLHFETELIFENIKDPMIIIWIDK